MQFIRRHPFPVLISLFILISLACQATTAVPAIPQATLEANNEQAIAAAVATIRADRPAETSVETVVTSDLPAVNQELQASLVNVYEGVNPAVVHIFVNGDFGVTLGSGSGFLFDSQGHIVTNNHVVADGEEYEVVFPNGDRIRATLVGTDVDSDLAVIKAESVPPDAQPVTLGDSNALVVGQFVVAIGNPFGETSSMSVGIISGLGRTLESQRVTDGGGRYSLPQVIQTDAAINPGNSGGPLLNLAGEVVGVNSAILTRTGANSGVGFSIPVNAVARVVPSLIRNGEYTYPYIGISMAPPLNLELAEQYDLPQVTGVYITGVSPDTPADEAGLVGNVGPGGDLIIAIDGNEVKDSSELISYLVFETEVGQTIELTVFRDGEEVVVPLTLSARP